MGLTILRCGFFPFHDAYGFQSDHQLVWADICNKDLLGHRPKHIYRALRFKARSNDPEVRESIIQRYINRCGNKEVISDFQTLKYFYQQQREWTDVRDKIIFLHESLASKIEKIQLEVDDSLGKFSLGLSFSLQLFKCIVITLTTDTVYFRSKRGYKRLAMKLENCQ